MPKKELLPPKLAEWADARARFHLSHAVVQMARELGMNPKKLGGKANHHQERWKAPLPDFIADLYEKRFGRRSPENPLSLEDSWRAEQATAAEKKKAKLARRAERVSTPGGEARAVEADEALGFAISAELSLADGTTVIVQGDLANRLSDALLEVMKPDVDFPPRASELHLFRTALEIGAEVWNATLDTDDARRARTLLDIALRIQPLTHRGSAEERLRFVIDIADRKRALFPNDQRRVTSVGVEPRGKNKQITASSAAFLPRRADPLSHR